MSRARAGTHGRLATVIGIAVAVVLLACSAFFSSTEIAIFSLPDDWPAGSRPADDSRVATLQALLADLHRLLVTVLVGNNLVNVAVASVVTVLVARQLPASQAAAVATAVTSVLVIVFGEVLPKTSGLGNAERWALRAARPLAFVSRLLWPLVWVFERSTGLASGALGGDSHIERPYTDSDRSPTGVDNP